MSEIKKVRLRELLAKGDEVRMAFIFLFLSCIMLGKITDFGTMRAKFKRN